MLKKVRTRRKRTVRAYAELRRAARRNLVARGAVLAALIFSPVLMFSPPFSVLAHSQERMAASLVGGGQGASPQSGGAQDQEETPQALDGWERPIIAIPKDRKPAPAPRRNISGIWDPGLHGIGVRGAQHI